MPDRPDPLWGFTCEASSDSVKRELELTCGTCGAIVCDVEAGDTLGSLVGVSEDHARVCPVTYTLSEAAAELGMAPDELLDFDQSLNGDWGHLFTRAELDQLRHVLGNLDDGGAYIDPNKKES